MAALPVAAPLSLLMPPPLAAAARPPLASLVAGLNALGVTPRDMISILQTIKAAGALQADIEVM